MWTQRSSNWETKITRFVLFVAKNMCSGRQIHRRYVFVGHHKNSMIHAYLPSTTIICCCSRKIALCKYPPQAVLVFVCVALFCVARRFRACFSSRGCFTVLLVSLRVFLTAISFGGPLARFTVPVSLRKSRKSCGIEWDCSRAFRGQLHWAFGRERKNTCKRQTIDILMAVKLRANATPPNVPLSLSEPAIS